jgi:hypothetical protein
VEVVEIYRWDYTTGFELSSTKIDDPVNIYNGKAAL